MTTQAVQRSDLDQQRVDNETAKLTLYHYSTCFFCASVKSVIAALNLKIELHDILENSDHRRDLVAQGGSSTVPCMRIGHDAGEVQWLYESRDIMQYLIDRFAPSDPDKQVAG